jgi:hypothetical protein
MEKQTDEAEISYPEKIVMLGVVLQKLDEALEPYGGSVVLSGSAPETFGDYVVVPATITYVPAKSYRGKEG